MKLKKYFKTQKQSRENMELRRSYYLFPMTPNMQKL